MTTWWFLVSLLLTIGGVPAADIPRPFTTQAECNVRGLARAAEINADKSLKQGVWSCFSIDFDAADPIPPTVPAEPLAQKREG